MKLGIYGCGMIVQHFLNFLSETKIEGITVVAITGTQKSERKLVEVCEKYNIPNWYTNTDDMLNEDIDTVYVAVPNNLHYEIAKKALLKSKHVICEKPFTSNYKEAEELSNIARKYNLILIEAVTTHYFPNMMKIKEKLSELGDIKMVVLNYSSYSSRYNDLKKGIVLPVFDPQKSGGALMDANVYNINFIVNLFGAPSNCDYYPNIRGDIDTSGVIIFDYGNFKCVAIGTKDCKAPVSVAIEGDEGYITVSSTVNVLSGFKFVKTNTTGVVSDDEKEENYNESKFHMYHEFVEFERIIKENDLEKANEMLDLSLTVANIQTILRKENNIVFAADKTD